MIITTPEFNRLKTENFKARLAQANLITKKDFDTKLKKIVSELLQINPNICLLNTNKNN